MRWRWLSQNDENKKSSIDTYLTDALHFADAGYKIIKEIGNNPTIEEVKLMKNFKPSINDQYDENNKLYIVKIAEDVQQDPGNIKTIKYELPLFANNSNELHQIVNDYLSQVLENMRLTTISETKWKFIK